MEIKNFIKLTLLASVILFTAPSCVKEGPMGLTGEPGANGADGTNAGETCAMCHKKDVVDLISTQFQLSKHHFGEAAFEEAGVVGCTPCHAQTAFQYVIENNIPATFTLGANGRYTNDYATTSAHAYGELGCATCHNKIHTTYGTEDLALTTVAAVPMTMWAGAKTIDLKADGGSSNLCVRCHQPRPQTNMQNGNVQDYNFMKDNPTVLAFDAENPRATTNIVRPSYRMHVHYGTAGAVYAGIGGVEFAPAGGETYRNSAHTEVASCIDCHMGAEGGKSNMVGRAGGHTFVAKGNFTTCNTAGCHTGVTATEKALWETPRAEIKGLLDQLAAKLTVGGVDILNRNSDAEHNLWIGLTTNNYDGYLNVYDPALAPTAGFQNSSPGATWTDAQKAHNLTLPKLSLTNAQYGALINFQLCLRDYSLGIHNLKYTRALLKNSIAVLP